MITVSTYHVAVSAPGGGVSVLRTTDRREAIGYAFARRRGDYRVSMWLERKPTIGAFVTV